MAATVEAAGEAIVFVSDNNSNMTMRPLGLIIFDAVFALNGKPAMEVAADADAYTVDVSSQGTWTASVSAGAAWCTLTNAGGTGNGTLTVNVTANTDTAPRTATVTVTSGTLTKTVTVTQAGIALEVNITTISVSSYAVGYIVGVTSNAAWTASVSPSSAIEWCTLTNGGGTGNGTLTVHVTANTATVTRAATITVTAGTAGKTVSVRQAAAPPYVIHKTDDAPRYAASNNAWTFGSSTLTWSDAIRIPECNQSGFSSSTVTPKCRSYTDGTIRYYYNWPYVTANRTTLCPSP
jgi:hypothetical protein